MYSRLLRFQAGPQVILPSLEVECELCESWEVTDRGTSYKFRLRPGVLWQDIAPVSGRPLIAQDLAASYERQGTPGWPNSGLLRSIHAIAAEDAVTLRVDLTAPDSDFLVNLADGHSKIISPEVLDLKGDLVDGPNIGSGPWIWGGDTATGYVLLSNPGYFEQGLPWLDRLQVHIIPKEETRIAAFRTGFLDVLDVNPGAWNDLVLAHPKVKSLLYPGTGMGLELAINVQEAPFNRTLVRQAVFRALDPWADIEASWGSEDFVSLGMPVRRADWLLSQEELRPYFNDPEWARKTLEDNTVAPVLFTLRVGDFGPAYIDHAKRIALALESVGFKPSIEKVDLKVFAEEVWFGGKYTMFLGATSPANTPNGYMLSILHSKGRYNTHHFSDPVLDRLIESQSMELDPILRRANVHQIQHRSFEGASRFMAVTPMQRLAWWPSVRGLYPNFASFEYSFWSRAWIESD